MLAARALTSIFSRWGMGELKCSVDPFLIDHVQSTAASGQKLLALVRDQYILLQVNRAFWGANFWFQRENHSRPIQFGLHFIERRRLRP